MQGEARMTLAYAQLTQRRYLQWHKTCVRSKWPFSECVCDDKLPYIHCTPVRARSIKSRVRENPVVLSKKIETQVQQHGCRNKEEN